jgi:class 3 adenylate cyclase/DNA-binding CsgD family transcriptional regulator
MAVAVERRPGTGAARRVSQPDAAEAWASSGDVGETQYVRSGDGYIAYQVLSRGATDLLVINESVLPMEALLENAHTASYLAKLAKWGRVIVFDRRGVGLSDPVTSVGGPTLDAWVADAVAVLDAVGSERSAVFSNGPSAGLIALQLAAGHPGRVSLLSLYDAIARYRWAPDYPWGMTSESEHQVNAQLRAGWGTPRFADRRGRFAATAARHPGFIEWATIWFRRGAAPSTVAESAVVLRSGDVRAALPFIMCPTVIVNHADVEDGRFLAEHIRECRYIELHDPCHLAFSSELDSVLAATREMRDEGPVEPEPRRVLTTLLFTDIVNWSAHPAPLDRPSGDARDSHEDVVRRHLDRFGGAEIKVLHDGILATFDGPTRAVQCALAICRESERRGVTVRSGVHTGEVEMHGADVSGPGVHVAQRLCSLAAGAQVLVTRSVVDLVSGAELRFEPLGDHRMKGLQNRLGVFEASPCSRSLPEVVGGRTLSSAGSTSDERLDELSPREREVLIALATGGSNAQIGAELFMSAATVKAHVSHLFVKLECTNRVQLAILAHGAGLAPVA